jgi:hypothetical protein
MKGLKFLLVFVISALFLGIPFAGGIKASSDSLYADFGGTGIWQYDGGVWAKLASSDPLGMAASGSLLYGNFGAAGLFKYDGTNWTQLSTTRPTKMVASGSLLYADFGSPYGVYVYDGTAWTPLASTSPQDMIVPVNPNIITDTKQNTAIGINGFQSNTTGSYNTASGHSALYNNSTGTWNTATGIQALYNNIKGDHNTASGASVLFSNTEGSYNTANGDSALAFNTTGSQNTAAGNRALFYNRSGNWNAAVGSQSLYNSTGSGNTAIGQNAGYNQNPNDTFTGSSNIYIGQDVGPGSLTESNTTKIGKNGYQNRAFIAGIYNVNSGSGIPVYVDGFGQLTTVGSSRLLKEDIRDMAEASSGLMELRPVTFHYKPEYANGPNIMQYGLIAEEVAEVYPGLVQYDPNTGKPHAVSYHFVNAMLLNEVQKLHKEIEALKEKSEDSVEQRQEISGLKEQNKELLEQNEDLSLRLSRLEAQLTKIAMKVDAEPLDPGWLSKLDTRINK